MAKAKKKTAARKPSRKAAPARKAVSPIPNDYSRVCPYLGIRGAEHPSPGRSDAF